jgi:hypothetical protein
MLIIAPWFWLNIIPGVSYVTDFYTKAIQWIVFKFNDWFLHIKDVLNTEGYGSGDTSYAWAEFYTILILSFIIGIIWTVLDKKKKDSPLIGFWLRNLIRYNLIIVAFSYGTIKLFALQMSFPTLSQLASPLGEFLPMRLCWMYMGYSVPYQTFTGVMEIMVGLLLLFRRTTPLGLIIGLGVFVNVFMLNLSYDIPVKLYSMQIVMGCLFLVVLDGKRYLNFFLFNKATSTHTSYDFYSDKRWQKIGRLVLKIAFIITFVGFAFYQAWDWNQQMKITEKQIIKQGVYTIKTFKKNSEVMPVAANDSLAWKDFIFDKQGSGSINTCDTLFDGGYGRGYFNYTVDKSKQTIAFKTTQWDTNAMFIMKYKIIDSKTLQLEGKVRKDTLYYELVRNEKLFPLAERQFHWISEANR